jgi:hypothetical protein
MDDNRTETLIRRNRVLLALAATVRADACEAAARAADRVSMCRQFRIALTRSLFELQHPGEGPSAIRPRSRCADPQSHA